MFKATEQVSAEAGSGFWSYTISPGSCSPAGGFLHLPPGSCSLTSLWEAWGPTRGKLYILVPGCVHKVMSLKEPHVQLWSLNIYTGVHHLPGWLTLLLASYQIPEACIRSQMSGSPRSLSEVLFLLLPDPETWEQSRMIVWALHSGDGEAQGWTEAG